MSVSEVQSSIPNPVAAGQSEPDSQVRQIDPNSENPSRCNYMRIAILLNLVVVAALTAFFAAYTAGAIPLENFTGMIGSSVFLTASSLMLLLSIALVALDCRK